MRHWLRALTRNWQLKLAALALAVLLWVVVSAEQVTTQWLPVPVQVVNRDPDHVVVGGPVPEQVEVAFVGPGRELWELALERPVLVLPVGEGSEDDRVLVLDPRLVRVPNGLSVGARDVRPSSVRILLRRVVTREVPVRLRVASRVRDRFVLTDTPTVFPATVLVTGPEDRVAAIRAVPTRPLELSGEDSTFSRVVRLDADSVPGVRLSTASVRVRGGMDRRVERIFPRVPVTPLPGAVVAPAEVDVRVQGPSRAVRAVDPAALRVVVPAGGLPETLPAEGVSVPVGVEGVPEGLRARAVPQQVRVSPPGVPHPAPGPDTPPLDTIAGAPGREP